MYFLDVPALNNAEACRRYYDRGGSKKIRAWNTMAKKRNAEYVKQIKEATPCADCNRHMPHYVMDFDHVTGEKTRDVSALVAAPASIKTIQAEIEKCEVVCAICHRVRTHFRRLGLPVPPFAERAW